MLIYEITECFVFVVDIPMCVGITEPCTHASQLNAAEFLWDVSKHASVFVQVRCNARTHTHTLFMTLIVQPVELLWIMV